MAKSRVFFYGLFMDQRRLAELGVASQDPGIGRLEGYQLRIGQRATLVPAPGQRAYGMLLTVDCDDLQALYAEASVADYVAESVVVVVAANLKESAKCYNLPVSKLAGTNPEYARALLRLAEELGFPEDYRAEIAANCAG